MGRVTLSGRAALAGRALWRIALDQARRAARAMRLTDRSMPRASERIREALASWPDVVALPHRFGGTEYRVGRRELGHVHGDALADLPFPVRVREVLVAAGRAERHHILPDTGWVSVPLRTAADVDIAIELFRLNYDRPWLAADASTA